MHGSDGLVKVGYSTGLELRLLAVGSRRRQVRLVSALELPRKIASKAERVAHYMLGKHRVRTCYGFEYFATAPAAASRCVRRAAAAVTAYAQDRDIRKVKVWHVVKAMRQTKGEANATGASGRPWKTTRRK